MYIFTFTGSGSLCFAKVKQRKAAPSNIDVQSYTYIYTKYHSSPKKKVNGVIRREFYSLCRACLVLSSTN